MSQFLKVKAHSCSGPILENSFQKTASEVRISFLRRFSLNASGSLLEANSTFALNQAGSELCSQAKNGSQRRRFRHHSMLLRRDSSSGKKREMLRVWLQPQSLFRHANSTSSRLATKAISVMRTMMSSRSMSSPLILSRLILWLKFEIISLITP